MAKVYLLCLVLGCLAHADQVNCIKWRDIAGEQVGTYCRPFSIRAGNGIQFSDDGIGRITITATGVAAGAGGADTQINFNSSGSLAGSSGLTWNNSTSTLTATHITGIANRPFIDVQRDCGLVGDGVTNDSTAIAACLAAYPGARLYFPPTNFSQNCSYFFASSITPPVGAAGTVLTGGSTAFLNNVNKAGGTTLCFPAGVTAINLQNCGCTIEYLSLLGSEGVQNLQNPSLLNFPSGANLPQTQRSISSIQRAANVLTVTVTRVAQIEGLTQQVGSTVKISGVVGDATLNGLCDVSTLSGNTAFGGNPNTFTCPQNGSDSGPFTNDGIIQPPTTGASTADGIRVCNNFTYILHVTIQNFGRHGINADSNAGHGCTVPFSDDLIVRDSILYGMQGDGYYCAGVDCNAHLLDGNAVYYNVMWGMEDQSSLGNTYIGNQISNNSHFWWGTSTPATKNITSVTRTSSTVAVVLASAQAFVKLGTCVFVAGVSDSSFNTTAGQCFFVTSFTDSTHFSYIQPGNPGDASSSGGTLRIAKAAEAYLSSGLDDGAQKIETQSAVALPVVVSNYVEGGQYCKFGGNTILIGGASTPACAYTAGSGDWIGNFITTNGCSGWSGILCLSNPSFLNNKDSNGEMFLRAGASTDKPYGITWNNHSNLRSWGMIADPSGTLGGSGRFEVDSQGYGQTRLLFFGKDTNSGNTYLNAEGTGAISFNRNFAGTNAGTGGVEFYSGGSSPSKVASVSSTGLVTPGTTTVGNLPSAASNPGALIRVSDSTTVSAEGQNCVGSSSNNALAFSNGSVWKCF